MNREVLHRIMCRFQVLPHKSPRRLPQNHDRDFPAGKILLVGGSTNEIRRRIKAPRCKFEHRLNLLSGHVVLLDDFFTARTHFEIFETVATAIRVS
jgi:hypothetical protein